MPSPSNPSTEKPSGSSNVENEELSSARDISQKDPLPSTTRVILLATCLTFANVLTAMGNTGVQVLLDEISASLDISENNLQWIFNSMQLPFGCFVLIAGRAADIWGRKRLFSIGMIIAASMTLIAGFMKNEIAFYIFRAMSGIGGALLASSNIGILAENTAPGRLRSLSIGICIAGLPLGGTIGFTVAAPLAAATSWRSVFFLVAGLDLFSLIGVFFLAKHQRETEERNDRRIDWIGGTLFTAGAVFLFFCLSQALSESKGFGTPYIIGLLVMSFLLLALAVVWVHYLETKTRYPPIMRISIVTRHDYRVAVVYFVVFCCISSYAGLMYSSQIYYQRYLDMKATELMLRYLPGPFVGTVCNIAVGILASKVSPVWFFVVGSAATATANVLYAAMDVHATYWTYQFFAQMLCVIGPDVTVVMGYIYLTHVVDLAEVAVAGASLQFFVALGFVCGPSLSNIIYTDLVKHKHGGLLTQAESKNDLDLLSSLPASFWFWGALGYTALVLSVIFLRNMAEVTHGKEASVDENEGVSEKGQAAVLDAADAMAKPSMTDETEGMTMSNGHLSKKG